MPTCPYCQGSGERAVFDGREARIRIVGCGTCSGAGRITRAQKLLIFDRLARKVKQEEQSHE